MKVNGQRKNRVATNSMDAIRRAERQTPAIAKVGRQVLPQYEQDNGPLTAAQEKAIERLSPHGRMKVKNNLF